LAGAIERSEIAPDAAALRRRGPPGLRAKQYIPGNSQYIKQNIIDSLSMFFLLLPPKERTKEKSPLHEIF
jgi:hypothetical protein